MLRGEVKGAPSADELGEEGGEDQDYEAYYEDRMSIK